MEPLQKIDQFDRIKVLSDAHRLAVLRYLMAGPETLSSLGKKMKIHPAQVRHHLKLLEKTGLVELVDTRVVRGFVEKYYRARARAFAVNEIILPMPDKKVDATIVILGSHDLALELLSRWVQERVKKVGILAVPVGSLDGLLALRQGNTQLAGCHLLDAATGEYNLPYVRHLFPDQAMSMLTLAYREQGLLVRSGNPLRIRGVEDLSREDINIINRNRGSGTRLWLDLQFQRLGFDPGRVRGYDQEARTHTRVAEAVAAGQVDAGLGLEAAARRFGLDFIPLFHERYDLVMSQEQMQDQKLAPLLDILQSGDFRDEMDRLGGYETGHTGDRIDTQTGNPR
jgi:putative molybdopterin biosynthesis protein